MGLEKSWFSLEEAEAKFGFPRVSIIKWIEDGVVRSEGEGDHLLVNGDDLDLIVDEYAFMPEAMEKEEGQT